MGPMKTVLIFLVAIACPSITTALPGASKEVDPKDPNVQKFLVSTLDQVKAPPKGTDDELTTLVKVTKVTFQVVSGIKYTYEFEAKGVKTQKLYLCDLVVISRPWAEGDVVQDFQCRHLLRYMPIKNEVESNEKDEKHKPCIGCPQEQDVKDPVVQQFLSSTLSQVKAPPKGTDNELITLIKVTRATVQVVSGTKSTYEFEARGVKTQKMYKCRIVVLSQPWSEGETVQDFQCHPIENLH